MTYKCYDMRIYENGFMFLGDFIPFNKIQSYTLKGFDDTNSLLTINFLYRPNTLVKCIVKDENKAVDNLLTIILNQKNICPKKNLEPIYETDRVYDLNSHRGKLIYYG